MHIFKYIQCTACTTTEEVFTVHCNDKIVKYYCINFQSWDMGKGFQMTDLYKTGWTVVALSVVFAAALALM